MAACLIYSSEKLLARHAISPFGAHPYVARLYVVHVQEEEGFPCDGHCHFDDLLLAFVQRAQAAQKTRLDLHWSHCQV